MRHLYIFTALVAASCGGAFMFQRDYSGLFICAALSILYWLAAESWDKR